MINDLSLFSSNETKEDLQTPFFKYLPMHRPSSVCASVLTLRPCHRRRYLLVPYYLGHIEQKFVDQQRCLHLREAQVRVSCSVLLRCIVCMSFADVKEHSNSLPTSYNCARTTSCAILMYVVRTTEPATQRDREPQSHTAPSRQDRERYTREQPLDPARRRTELLELAKREKQNKQRLAELTRRKLIANGTIGGGKFDESTAIVDDELDEIEREIYLVLIDDAVASAVKELQSIAQELPMVEQFERAREANGGVPPRDERMNQRPPPAVRWRAAVTRTLHKGTGRLTLRQKGHQAAQALQDPRCPKHSSQHSTPALAATDRITGGGSRH